MEETRINNEPVGFPGATQTMPPAQKKNWKWLVILILFLIVIGGVTFFVFKSSKSTSTDNSTPEPTSGLTGVATPQPTSLSTPSATAADKTSTKISVLNGTGVAGEAGILSQALKDLGYTNVTTGNASTQNATDTEVIFASNISQDVVTEITGKLQSLYTKVVTNNSTLSGGTDVQVTTGLRKGQTAATAAPVASSTPSASASATPQ
jgi:hypothetical protein